uniref:(northern house mosquito) hypothetical protein n=1 Tax=Culex pipiens TaxID=7175 RepID=A0A8D8C5Z2_CULPI
MSSNEYHNLRLLPCFMPSYASIFRSVGENLHKLLSTVIAHQYFSCIIPIWFVTGLSLAYRNRSEFEMLFTPKDSNRNHLLMNRNQCRWSDGRGRPKRLRRSRKYRCSRRHLLSLQRMSLGHDGLGRGGSYDGRDRRWNCRGHAGLLGIHRGRSRCGGRNRLRRGRWSTVGRRLLVRCHDGGRRTRYERLVEGRSVALGEV